jgi:branched-chain amino acid transport system substrate-binding protein
VEAYLARPVTYDGHGALVSRDFVVTPPPTTTQNCIFVARWDDAAYDGRGGWLTTTPAKEPVCYLVPHVAYTP